jgi:hypothetical protein
MLPDILLTSLVSACLKNTKEIYFLDGGTLSKFSLSLAGGQMVQETCSLYTGIKLHCIPHTCKVEMKAAALNVAGLKLKNFETKMKYFTVPAM